MLVPHVDRLLKLAIQINVAKDINDLSKISFKITDKDDIQLALTDPLAANI